jgi:hypothetical protein
VEDAETLRLRNDSPSYRPHQLNEESSDEEDNEESKVNERHHQMRENLDKARSLLSTRMDDVRALKRMVSDTKETIEIKRRQRLMQEIRSSATYGEHFKTTGSNGQKNFLLGRPSAVQINH